MAYSRTEYRKETDDHRDNNEGGWRSWFGLGSNKDRDDDRGYSYQRTTTYRDEHPQSNWTGNSYNSYDRPAVTSSRYTSNVDRDSYNTVGGYAGARGGYGYTTTGDFNTRPTYGQTQTYGYDREHPSRDQGYYRAETRTYGGDRDNTYSSYPQRSYGGDNTVYKRETTTYGDRSPSRGYGFSGDNNYSTSYNTSRGYNTDRDTVRGNDYTYRQTATYGDRDRHPGQSYGFSGDYNRPTGGYSTSYRY